MTGVNTSNRAGKRVRTKAGFEQPRFEGDRLAETGRSNRIFERPKNLASLRSLHFRGRLINNTIATWRIMGIRKYKPTTPSRRGSSIADFAEVTHDARRVAGSSIPKKNWPTTRSHHDAAPRWQPQARPTASSTQSMPTKMACDQGRSSIRRTRTARIRCCTYADGERYIVAPEKLKR